MYSLGVVFFEMWNLPFRTAMERSIRLGDLSQNVLARDFFVNSEHAT